MLCLWNAVQKRKRGATAVFIHYIMPPPLQTCRISPLGNVWDDVPEVRRQYRRRPWKRECDLRRGASQGFYRSWPMKTGEGERRGEEADNIQRKDVHGTETRGARCLHGLADRFPGA